jgi:prepilin-type N-terminal cleavage/methylation domain-containing protein
MMNAPNKQSGFTAVELLITLFVAAAFLIAAYGLFNLVIKDGGATRAESRASNVAYDYMRKYAASSTTIPCTASTPLTNAPLTVDGLSNVTVSITISCLPDAISTISKVEVALTYNAPAQTVKYATYTNSTGSSGTATITNGLVAWWKLNGDTNNAIGTPNGVNNGATSTTNQSGSADKAYSFNGSNSSITTASSFGLGTANVTISCWVFNPTATNSGAFVKVGGTTAGGYGIGIGASTGYANSTPGTRLVIELRSVRWASNSTAFGTGWHHVAMVIDGSGVPTAYLDGVAIGTFAGTGPQAPSSSTVSFGGDSGNFFNGSVDDVRLYNRALTLAEILSLYSGGAQ